MFKYASLRSVGFYGLFTNQFVDIVLMSCSQGRKQTYRWQHATKHEQHLTFSHQVFPPAKRILLKFRIPKSITLIGKWPICSWFTYDKWCFSVREVTREHHLMVFSASNAHVTFFSWPSSSIPLCPPKIHRSASEHPRVQGFVPRQLGEKHPGRGAIQTICSWLIGKCGWG